MSIDVRTVIQKGHYDAPQLGYPCPASPSHKEPSPAVWGNFEHPNNIKSAKGN